MDPILGLLIQAHGETLGRLIFGSYRLAQTAVEHAKKREEAEAALAQPQNGLEIPNKSQVQEERR